MIIRPTGKSRFLYMGNMVNPFIWKFSRVNHRDKAGLVVRFSEMGKFQLGKVYSDGETCSPGGEFGGVFVPTAEVIVDYLFEIGDLVDVLVTGLRVVEGGSRYHLLVDFDAAAGGGTEAAEEIRGDKFAAF